MRQFEFLFGIKSSRVKKNCIFLPLLQKEILSEFKVKNFSRGKLYGIANTDDFTFIHTGMGATCVGDAVLYLKGTACQNIILLGSCGLVSDKSDLSIGSLVSPFKCYAQESFTEMLLGRKTEPKAFYANKKLFENFLMTNQKQGLRKVTCSTISSLKLEEELIDSFIEQGIDVVDMECSALFSASHYAGLKAIALFYVSDIVKKIPFYMGLEPTLKSTLFCSIKKAIALVCEFIKKNPNA